MLRRKAFGASHTEGTQETAIRPSDNSSSTLLPHTSGTGKSTETASGAVDPLASNGGVFVEGGGGETSLMIPSPSKEKNSSALFLHRQQRILPQIGLMLSIAIFLLTLVWMSGDSRTSSTRLELNPDNPDYFSVYADDDDGYDNLASIKAARHDPRYFDLNTRNDSWGAPTEAGSPTNQEGTTVPPAPKVKPMKGRRWTDEDQAYVDALESNSNRSSYVLHPKDYIYRPGSWDGPPVVLEDIKLVFFTVPKVGCTVFKQLFRRMEGHGNWKKVGGKKMLPHNPMTNGLKYLRHYPLTEANEMMTSSEWTRAIFVRHPIDRFLSAYYDKGQRSQGKYVAHHCCTDFVHKDKCAATISRGLSMMQFFNLTQERCAHDPHWRQQVERMESKYWKYIDFVGHIETAHEDAKRLLDKFGLWEECGKAGWGKDGTEELFQSTSGVRHKTTSNRRNNSMEDPFLNDIVSKTYQSDFNRFYK